MTHTVISSEFLLWSETCLLWAIIAYGITADPLPDETDNFPWRAWKTFFILRCICGVSITFLMSRSTLLGDLDSDHLGCASTATLASPEPRKARLRWVSFVVGGGIAIVAVAVVALSKFISR
jgi:hypothetical protein